MPSKRKVTITLDGERRRRAERLAALLDEFDATDGPLPTDPDEDARLERLLGGAA